MDDDTLPMPGYEAVTDVLEWLSPYVRQCGNAPRGLWKIENRKLLDYLLVYIRKGEGWFTIGSNSYEALPGDLFWIPPNTLHSMESHSPVMICPYIHFDLIYRYPHSHWEFSVPSGTRDLSLYGNLKHPDIPESSFSPLSGRYRIYNHKPVGLLIDRICREAAIAHKAHTISISGLLMQIFGELFKGIEEPSVSNRDRYAPVMESAAAYIQQNIQNNLSVEELAENSSLSIAYFRRLFNMHFGISPARYIRQMRIARSRDLMTYTDYNLGEISIRCGYSDVHSLSKAFRQVVGLSPREYRKFGKNLIDTDGREKSYPG